MADQTDKVWAIDRETKKPGQYDPAFLDAWPNGYLRIDAPKTTKKADRSSSKTPVEGGNQEGGA